MLLNYTKKNLTEFNWKKVCITFVLILIEPIFFNVQKNKPTLDLSFKLREVLKKK